MLSAKKWSVFYFKLPTFQKPTIFVEILKRLISKILTKNTLLTECS